MVYLPAPRVENAGDPGAMAAALSAQRASLAQVLDSQSGFKLRRTKGINDDKGSFASAVIQDEPKDGVVAYSTHFIGVSDKIAEALSAKFGKVEVRRVEFVDSQVSQQLRTDGALAVLYALIAILIYIAIRFDFFFAPGAIVALIQDTFGAFLVFVFARYEFDLPSVAALLTVLGVSINSTIVIYDRIREDLPKLGKKQLDDAQVTAAVNQAVNDTLSRTINTTLTLVIASMCLWYFAGGVISSFAMVLTVGLTLGAISSTFASPATYLFMRRRYGHLGEELATPTTRGRSREDKARGVV
jgi:preprotein translocase subunit SecF